MGTNVYMRETEGQIGNGSTHVGQESDVIENISLDLADLMLQQQEDQEAEEMLPRHYISWGSLDSEEESLIGSIICIQHSGKKTRETGDETILVNGDTQRQKTAATTTRRNSVDCILCCASNDCEGPGSSQQSERVNVESQWNIREVMDNYRFNE